MIANKNLSRITIAVTLFLLISCSNEVSPNKEMIDLLADIEKSGYNPKNSFNAEAKLNYYDSLLKEAKDKNGSDTLENIIVLTLLELGDEEKAVAKGEDLIRKISVSEAEKRKVAMKTLALAYLRLGERINCIKDHSGESCIFPIAGRGVHADKTSSGKAIELYQQVLNTDPTDLESRWLLNIAYMTVGGYPGQVPPIFLIKGLDTDTSAAVKPFVDAAVNVGLNIKNLSGGSIVDDFNNDGYLDLVTSSASLKEGMHYCRNNTNGTFTEVSDSSELGYITGGLNIVQTDYNNDGFKDVFVLRGGWMKQFGKQPKSLLRNNGNGTFTDVTKESGLLSFHPTQTATWADFNNDGWLDVFIGNETSSEQDVNPCELYINNKNGTFSETAQKSGCQIIAFVKGVTSGDYDNDGLADIFISTLDGRKILLKNESTKGGIVKFTDVTQQAGLSKNTTRTFPTWFWDYDNDGWLDILVCGYEFSGSLAWYAAAEALGVSPGKSGKVFLFRNNHDGTFEEVSDKVGLNRIAFAMGSNFGDIDNDGYLDMYLGTGNPLYQSLVPNKLFKNIEGRRFIDVTTSARVGNLQKGHGVSFADLDNDGDEDIYIDMGGIYKGDAYQNSLYTNPGQNNNRWINISLEGTTSNRIAIGAKIKVTFDENGVTRSVYRDVNSGGSFGSNPLTQHIGIGQATTIQSIEIKWPVTDTTQVFKNLQPGNTLKIKEGVNSFSEMQLRKVDFTAHKTGIIQCSPKR
ncbi:MAG: CRTAC1 family protein [Chitinophagaceae bacterium]